MPVITLITNYCTFIKRLASFGLLLLLVLPVTLSAQNRYTISGTVKDTLTGENLIGATIKIAELKDGGAITNDYGYYALTVPADSYHLLVSYVGYITVQVKLQLTKNTIRYIDLKPSNQLKEVVVNASRQLSDNVNNPQMGVNRLDINQLNQVPVLLGEKDILKTIQLLPGVKSTGDANTGFYVRGGAADQNLILLDGAPIYNATHLFGFFSIFNSDAIKDVSLYKGGMPASYGGRLSSVLDVKMDDGNNKQYGLEGGIGLISSRIKIDGPVAKNKSSFMISARRTYADIFLKLSGDSTLKGSSLYFYDLNVKFNSRINDKNSIYLSGYYGQDNIGIKDNFSTKWGNATASLRWNHIYNSKLFSNASFIYSNYNYNINNNSNTNELQSVASTIQDFSLKQDFTYFTTSHNTLSFGLSAVHHGIVPGNVTTTNANYAPNKTEKRYAYEFAAYITDNAKVFEKLNLEYGVRLNQFVLTGPGTFYIFDANGSVTGADTYTTGTVVKRYFNVEPRISANYTINAQTSVKASYNHNTQNIHLLSNSTSSLPTDLYVMSSNNIKPGIADQLALGYYKNFDQNIFEFSTEVYYKWLQNQVDYRNNAQLNGNVNVESQLLYGIGRAYGVEFFLKKKYGKFNGWLGYTLSRTENRFDAINNGSYFPARQDRTHDISMTGIYKLNSRWLFSSVFVYGTGNAITFPSDKYKVGGLTTYYYSGRNQSRLPADSRLDIGATLAGRPHKKFQSSWTFSLYNVYNRKNPYSVIFRDSNGNPSHTEAVETSLFGLIPSATWNFKF